MNILYSVLYFKCSVFQDKYHCPENSEDARVRRTTRTNKSARVRNSARVKKTTMSQEARISRVQKTGRMQELRRKRQKNNSLLCIMSFSLQQEVEKRLMEIQTLGVQKHDEIGAETSLMTIPLPQLHP
jgi:hypothetical protein